MYLFLVLVSGGLTCLTFPWVSVALGMQARKNSKLGQNGVDILDAIFQLVRWVVWLVQALCDILIDYFLYASRVIGIFPAAIGILLACNPKATKRQVVLTLLLTLLGQVAFLLVLIWMRPLLMQHAFVIECSVALSVLLMGHVGAKRNEKKYEAEGTAAASWQLAISRYVAYISSVVYFALVGKYVSSLLYLWLSYRQHKVVLKFFYGPSTRKESEGQR